MIGDGHELSKFRVIAAALLTPLIPALLLVCLPSLLLSSTSRRYDQPEIVFFSLLFSYGGLLLIGLPLVLFLRRLGFLSIPMVVFGGAGLSVIVWYFVQFGLSYLLDSNFSFSISWLGFIWSALLAVSIALPFCLIVGIPWRRIPILSLNRDAKKEHY